MSHSKHLRLRPSDAERWLDCTMSPVLIAENHDELPAEVDNEYNRTGTLAHEFAAAMLQGESVDIPDPVMAGHLESYMDFVLDKVRDGDNLLVEATYPLWYMPQRNGTADAVIHGPGRVYITDLKYGEGVAVYARDNPQLAIYGRNVVEGLINDGSIDPTEEVLVILAIFQPRCSHGEPVTLWALSLAELFEFTDRIEATAYDIQKGINLRYSVTADNCRWCKAAGVCGERIRRIAGDSGFDILPADTLVPDLALLPAPDLMTPAQLGLLLELEPELKAWLTAARKHAVAVLSAGDPKAIPGWKLTDGGLGDREWVDEKAADVLLANKLPANARWKRTLISPAQAEKLIPKAERTGMFNSRWDKLVFRPKRDTRSLVRDTDPRESITIQAELEFMDLTPGADDGAELL